MKKAIEILVKIAHEFNDSEITWALGGSMMLFFQGIVDHFNDIDIMVMEKDINGVIEILNTFGDIQTYQENGMFKTKHYYKYHVDGVDIDVMAGLVIINEGINYDCSLNIESMTSYVLINDDKVPLQSIETWRYYYELMGRIDRVKTIDENYHCYIPE